MKLALRFTVYGLLGALWVYVATVYSQIPDTIIQHYNVLGNADKFGSKSSIFVLLGVITVITAMLEFLQRFPRSYNYLVKITEDNKDVQYQLAVQFIQHLQLIIVVLFGYITYSALHSYQVGIWAFAFVGAIFLRLIWYCVESVSNSKTKVNSI